MEIDTEQGKTKEVGRLLALVETERRYYQEIVASMPVGLLILSSSLDVVSSNREIRRILGLQTGERLQGQLEAFLPPLVVEQVRHVLATGEPQTDVLVPVPDEPGRQLRINICQIRNGDDRAEHEVLLTAQDSETAPAIGGEEPDALPALGMLESLDAAIWAAEIPEKRFLYVNPQAQEIFGYKVETWLDSPSFWSDRIHPEDREWVLQAYDRSIDSWTPLACEYRAVTSQGEVIWVRESACLLQDLEGRARHLIGFAVDITQRRLLERQYVQAQRNEAAGRLSKLVAGELTNQTLLIERCCEGMLRTLEPTHALHPEIREMLASVERLRALTGQISPERPARPEAEELIELREFLSGLAPKLQDAPVEVPIELKLFPAAMGVRAGAAELERLVTLLVKRATREMNRGTRITIGCSPTAIDEPLRHATLRPGVYAVILVEDDGATLDAATRATLFEPSLPASELARSYRLVRDWGGDIAVANRFPRGNIFQIYLPRIGEKAASAVSTAEPALEPRQQVILVVENDASIRSLIRKVLLRQNYEVIEAADADKAMLQGEERAGAIDLMIADVTLPEVATGEALRRMQKVCPGVRVLYLPGFADTDEEATQQFPPGAASLQKPFTLSALLNKVRETLT